jgi:hypothetical protein
MMLTPIILAVLALLAYAALGFAALKVLVRF